MNEINTNELSEDALNKIKEKKINIIKEENNNKKCFDCKKLNPEIISLYNGIFICKKCAKNIHSKFNKNINLLIDNNLRNLSLKGIQYLYYGGNKKLYDFINEEYPYLKTINKKQFYLTKEMNYYRQRLKYLINGRKSPVKPLDDKDFNKKIGIKIINIKEKDGNNKNNLNINILNNYYEKKKENNLIQNQKNQSKIKEIILNKIYDSNPNNLNSFDNSDKTKVKKIKNFNLGIKSRNNNIKTLILDNETNYFYVENNNHINNLNITTINKDNEIYHKNKSVLKRKLNIANIENNPIYKKPNILISENKKNNSYCFRKKKVEKKTNQMIQNEYLLKNKLNNSIINNRPYCNTLMNNYIINTKYIRNESHALHHTLCNSDNLNNNSSYFNNTTLINLNYIFKKKKLKNSFSISSKRIKTLDNFIKNKNSNINISIDEGSKFQIIPNIKQVINKRKRNLINIKDKEKINADNFMFYTITDIKNNNNQQVNNNQFNLKKLLNQIIKIKNKHKKKNNIN